MPDDQFLQQLRATFLVEAREHLQVMSRGLLALEQAPSGSSGRQPTLVQEVFRAAHSLKGAAAAVELGEIESLCQLLEDHFASWQGQRVLPLAGALDVLHRALDTMAGLLAPLAGSAARVSPGELAALRRDLRRLAAAGAAERAPQSCLPVFPTASAQAAPAVPAVAPAATAFPEADAPPMPSPPTALQLPARAPEETVRVGLPKLAAQLTQAEEMLVAKLAAGQRVADLRSFSGWLAEWREAWSAAEPEARRLRERIAGGAPAGASELLRVLDFHDWSGDAVRAAESRMRDIGEAARQDHDTVGKLVDDLLGQARTLLLLPFGSITGSFARLVRDLCRAQGKQAELRIEGEQLEIDKRILEEMKDPLVHMLRNAVDHGVEPPGLRLQRGKPAQALITLSLSQAVGPAGGSQVLLRLSDDGEGVDRSRLKAAALERGLLAAEEAAALDDAAVLALAFRSELSTRDAVTEVSGRGLGLAIVQERASKLGGAAWLESTAGAGTTLAITLPAVRAAFRGVLCDTAGQSMLLPTPAVERVARVRQSDIRTVEGRETVLLDGRVLALARLSDLLGLVPASAQDDMDWLPLVLVGTGEQALALGVDRVRDEQEVLLKPLRPPLVRVRHVAAAGVLGSGQVVPILNVADLLRTARRGVRRLAPVAAAAPRAGRAILLAEDSITSRMLLKTILEAAGHTVTTATDGLEAFALLRTESFDLLVSDVEMPRLNGFDLTQRVRADAQLAALPVVLVTALETRTDRERGIDAGANAYITKGGFDQNRLLEAVERLT